MKHVDLKMPPRIFIVDGDEATHIAIKKLTKLVNLKIISYHSAQAFLNDYSENQSGCLLLALYLSDMSGLELFNQLLIKRIDLPVILLIPENEFTSALMAIKDKVFDFTEKPVTSHLIVERIQRAIKFDACCRCKVTKKQEYQKRFKKLTTREYQVITHLLAGKSNKAIANDLNIHLRTVQSHYTHIMNKMEVGNIVRLVHIASFCDLLPKSCQVLCEFCQTEDS
ncbi:LuxR C-terminal-related transcriptional regulator [Candidatus Parabeggiatoa sp. HSG14]|uniref:response regulator transcription factor n=1 Tax=Candidatus Parabeggiatoa sp. HSG14 TaxID=3055593 RepID=UPI0025A75DEA|nr:LuxR C-terminal-related transcriptional regulator [Thiotrichales bacterium HSG14]